MQLAGFQAGRTAVSQIEKPDPKQDPQPSPARAALTAAAIAALLVQTSRQAYYATGHPCACPDDLMRNGRRCGNKGAYRRPGGASPLCYAADITPGMIAKYRKRISNMN
jgi:hypothetical protein